MGVKNTFESENLKVNVLLSDLGIHGSVMLKWIVEE
jgi:hypothetical protein